MRILVYPHDLAVGGSQLNAIELAAAVRDRGHTVAIYGRPGSLNARIDQLGLEFIAAPKAGHRPSPRVVKHLREIVRDRRIDVVHGYEWPPALEAALAALGQATCAPVATVMSMSVAPFIPHTMTVQVGTEQIACSERSRGRLRVELGEPPVDLAHNVSPPAGALQDFCDRWGLADDVLTIVCVGRLAHQLKLEGLLSAIRAAHDLADRLPVRLLLVGDGPAKHEVAAAAATANRRAGREIVTLTGEMLDPRAAYAMADIVIGMGGSALRALAFGKPLIVQGERGYFQLLSPQTAPEFLWHGWYGVGESAGDGPALLRDLLTGPLLDRDQRDRLGAYGRHVVEDRFSLSAAASRQIDLYARCGEARVRSVERAVAMVRALLGYGRYQVRRRCLRWSGRRVVDDFNAQPVAGGPKPPVSIETKPDLIVYMAGVPWDAIAGTDRRLVTAVSEQHAVLWIDPPVSIISLRRARRTSARDDDVGLSQVSPTVWRLRVRTVPGFSRPVGRSIALLQVHRSLRRAVRAIAVPVDGVVLASALGRFPSGIPGRRLYYVTDDWPEAAGLMGLSRRAIMSDQRHNLRDADVIAAVSSTLTAELRVVAPAGRPVHVLPNGCDSPARSTGGAAASSAGTGRRFAGLIGQLNERLDLDVLEAVASSGTEVLVVGPRTDRDPRIGERLDRFLASPSVLWVGEQPAEEIPRYLARAAVGMTPYTTSEFNRASFPLKTLEYLAAGLPVVSTDLPATRWLDTTLIDIADTPAAFAEAVVGHLAPIGDEAATERRAFAEAHSWRARADALLALLGTPDGRPGRP